MFWAYGEFSKLEKICINSFASQGYSVNLWTYGSIANIPSNVNVQNAREILSEELVFLNKAGSYASFSDYFRYGLLNKVGGLYVDTDVIALVDPLKIEGRPFLVTERVRPFEKNISNFIKKITGAISSADYQINNNVIFNPEPKKGNIIDMAYEYSARFPKENITWGEIGPLLLTSLIKKYKSHNFDIKDINYANSIDHWNCPNYLLEPNYKLPIEAKFLHCYNEMWKRGGISKDINAPEGSLMNFFSKKYLY